MTPVNVICNDAFGCGRVQFQCETNIKDIALWFHENGKVPFYSRYLVHSKTVEYWFRNVTNNDIIEVRSIIQ